MNILAPSILAADVTKLGEDINKTVRAGAKYVHIDVMDGSFVPALSYGQCVVEGLRKCTDAVFDVHLMVVEPLRYIEEFKRIGADIITVHYEACKDLVSTLKKIKEVGCKAGLSIKPGTDVSVIKSYLNLVDMVLIMSVEPGLGGQKYIEASTDRIKEARTIIHESGLEIDIEVDGGVCLDNLKMILEAGANVIVSGSSIYRGDIEKNTSEFMDIMNY